MAMFPFLILIKTGFNPLTTKAPHHIKAVQLIRNANQLTGFYMMGEIGRQWVTGVLKKNTA